MVGIVEQNIPDVESSRHSGDILTILDHRQPHHSASNNDLKK
jgi:hypothetical protein